MKTPNFLPLCSTTLALSLLLSFCPSQDKPQLFEADNKAFQYTGRVDFQNPKLPKFWAPGVTIQAKFKGTVCDVILKDEERYHSNHNFVSVAIDDGPVTRLKLTTATNTIRVAEGLSEGAHTLTLCKGTEAGIGYLEFVGIRCESLLPLPKKPSRKLEFVGDSITAGAGSDTKIAPCGKGQWYDQNNAYESYGVETARKLKAQWQLTAVSGIGLIHSCCDMKITMPEVFDKTDPNNPKLDWDTKRYQPDAVTVCLGQNDGAQNAAQYRATYLRFIGQIRGFYPKAKIVLLSSPMADSNLRTFMKDNLTQVVKERNATGDRNVSAFFFSRSFNDGCGGHPDLAQHRLIADELAAYLKTTLKW